MRHNYTKFIVFTIIIFQAFCLFAKEDDKKNAAKDATYILTKEANMLYSLEYLMNLVLDNTPQIQPIETETDQNIYYRKALQNYNDGNYIDALRLFLMLWKFDQTNASVLYYIKTLQQKIGYIQEDVETLKDLGDIVHIYNKKIKDSIFEKKYITAFDYYERLLLVDKKKNRFAKQMKFINDKMDYIIEHVGEFNIEQFHYARSYIYFCDGYLDKAIEEWEKVLSINPENREIQQYYFSLKSKDNHNLFAFRKVNFLNQKAIDLYYNGEFEKAQELFNNILEIAPDNEVAKFYINEIDKNLKNFNVLFGGTNIEQNKITSANIGKIESENRQDLLNKKDKIEKIVKEAEQDNKKLEERSKLSIIERTKQMNILYREGMEFYELGEYDKARLKFEEVLKHSPDNPKIVRMLNEIKTLKKTKR